MTARAYLDRFKFWAGRLRIEVVAIGRAASDPRTPWPARALAMVLVAYAASPVDLIPDFIPVLGLLDDMIILPLGVALVLRLIPPDVMAEHRRDAAETQHLEPSRFGLFIVVAIWIAALAALTIYMKRRL